MIELTYCTHRLPGLTHREIQEYWYERHVPLIYKHQGILLIGRYVRLSAPQVELNWRVAQFRSGSSDLDGIAEVWYENREAFFKAANDPAPQGALRELLQDERRFIAPAPSTVWMNEIIESS